MSREYRRRARAIVTLAPILVVAALTLNSSAAASSIGSPAQAQDAGSVLDGVFTADQAAAGKQQFQDNCQTCHSVAEHTGGNFSSKWAGTTLNEMFELISNTMPDGEPGKLKPQEYASIVAFFLKESGYPEGAKELPSDVAALTKIRVEPLAK
jgi:S-disulfanyl-L-cysteine oxidoreductase SoxD